MPVEISQLARVAGASTRYGVRSAASSSAQLRSVHLQGAMGGGTSTDNRLARMAGGGGSRVAHGESALVGSADGRDEARDADLLAILQEATRDASAQNWDGEGARALSKSVLTFARKFLQLLPASAQAPEIYPDPLGRVVLQWHIARDHVLNASVGETGGIAYAWHVGDSQGYASDNISNGIPRALLDQLSRLLAWTKAANGSKASRAGRAAVSVPIQ